MDSHKYWRYPRYAKGIISKTFKVQKYNLQSFVGLPQLLTVCVCGHKLFFLLNAKFYIYNTLTEGLWMFTL